MNWSRWYRLASYARSSLWVVPFVAIAAEQVVLRLVLRLDDWLGWTFYGVGVQGVQVGLQTVITLTLSFLVFTFGSLLVAIQVASGQLTPRIIATTLLRDNVVRYTVGLFVFTLLFAMGVLTRTDATTHELAVLVAVILGLLSIAGFLYFIDYAARLLRPVSIVARVSEQGFTVIEDVYPDVHRGEPDPTAPPLSPLGPPGRVVPHEGKSEIFLAANLAPLLAEAQRPERGGRVRAAGRRLRRRG